MSPPAVFIGPTMSELTPSQAASLRDARAEDGPSSDASSVIRDLDSFAYPPLPPDQQPAIQALAAILSETPTCGITSESDGRQCSPFDVTSPPALPGYEIVALLGHGGMGVVYKARQVRLNRFVAIKTLLAGAVAGPELVARFRVEAESAGRLQHPNIVQIYEVSECGEVPYLAMEFVGGGSLEEKLRSVSLSTTAAADLIEQLAEAVQAAHATGVIHRDLKPSNVLLTVDGMPKVSDFGLAKRLDQACGTGLRTRTGAVLGTPNYMAPEQAAGDGSAIGPGVDIYALGAILYELLTGRPPFRAADYLQTLEQVRTREPISPARLQPGLPRDLVTICLKCLEKDPASRYASAADLAADIQRFRTGQPIIARPAGVIERALKWTRRRPWQAAVVALILISFPGALAGSAWYERRHEEEVQRAAAAERETREQRLRLLANFQKSHDTLGQLLTRMEEDDSRSRDPRAAHLQREVEETALRYYNDLLRDLEGDQSPEARTGVARVLCGAAAAHRLLGQRTEALERLAKARELLEILLADRPDDVSLRCALADCLFQQADFSTGSENPQGVDKVLTDALKLDESLLMLDPRDASALKNQACCYSKMTALSELRSDRNTAAGHAALAADSWSRLLDTEPSNHVIRSRLGLALKEQVRLEVACERPKQAEAVIERAIPVLSPMLDPIPDGLDALWGPVWLAEIHREWGLILVPSAPAKAVEKYSRAIRIIDSVLAKEPQLLRGRVVLSQLYTYRAMAFDTLAKHSEMIRDRERACEFADGVHHFLCRIDLGRCLIQVGDYQRAVREAQAGAESQAIPGGWRVAVARIFMLASGLAERDKNLSPEQCSSLRDGYRRQALTELRRCHDCGYLADEKCRQEVLNDRTFDGIRSEPQFNELIWPTQASTGSPAAPAPAGSK
jgi:tetratricopeptide (TPR) repeat protein/tRNA A-37 threonylcarbamoyl transferase component Bud32